MIWRYTNDKDNPVVIAGKPGNRGVGKAQLKQPAGVALHDALQNPYEPCWLEGYGHNNMPYDRVFLYARCFLGELNKVRRNAEREQGKPVVELFQKAGSA